MVGMEREQAIAHIRQERARQDAKWGEQNHNPLEWLSILTEEVGELAKAINKLHWNDGDLAPVCEEAAHVGAVAVAFIECLRRGYWMAMLDG